MTRLIYYRKNFVIVGVVIVCDVTCHEIHILLGILGGRVLTGEIRARLKGRFRFHFTRSGVALDLNLLALLD